MPIRKEILANNEIYHVFNRTIDKNQIFHSRKAKVRFLKLLWYYQYQKPALSYSKYRDLNQKSQIDYHNSLVDSPKNIEIYAYVLMPNHFHLLLKQKKDNGISHSVGTVLNSFTKTHNQVNGRYGPLFIPQFKSVRIESNEECMHVSRYIHLNPITSYLIKDVRQLESYEFSSWNNYKDINLNTKAFNFVNTEFLLSYFGDSFENYSRFVSDQISYQRELSMIKHLTLD